VTTPLSIIPHSRPTIGQEEARALAEVVTSGQIAQGPLVAEFERGMAALLGVAGGVAVNSGTAALELALLALGVGQGDEVILPSYVCTAPWLAVVRVGGQPRIVDIEPATYAIDPDSARKALSPRTKAIIVPHLFGLPAELTRLEALGVPLIEDCAQTLTATQQGRQVGSVGTLTVCSFYATKLLCTGEGGMLLSKVPALLERARALREYDEEPNLNPASFNYKMTELQAAMGLSQLQRLRSFLDRRAAIAIAYQTGLASADLDLPVIPEGRSHVFYRYVAKLRGPAPPLDSLVAQLERQGVQCRRPVFRALHQYLGGGDYPVTDDVSNRALSLPIYPSLTDDEIARIIRTLCSALEQVP